MFKSRWGALFFVCATAFGAANLIGGEDDQGVLLSTADELSDARKELGKRKQELSEPDERPVLDAGNGEEFTSGFAPDEDLIDDTRGFDPVPDVDPAREIEKMAEEGDVIVHIKDN